MERVIEPALLKEEIGENIRALREASNLSIEEFAEKMRLTPGYIGLIERGRRSFTIIQMISLADIFGVTLDELIPSVKIENWPQVVKIIKLMRRMDSADIAKVNDLCESLLEKMQ